MFFLSDSLLLSLVIYPFSEICSRSVHRSSRFVYLSVLEDDSRGNMIAHIVIDNKGEIVLHLLTVLGMVVLSLVVSSFGRTILQDSNSLLWDEGSGDTLKCNCGGYSVSMQVQVIG